MSNVQTTNTIDMQDLIKEWEKDCSDFLKGKVVKKVRYMTKSEADATGWFSRPLIIEFSDGTYVMPMADDEGNDGGAMYTSDKELSVIPVMRD